MTNPQDLLKTLETKLDEALDAADETIKDAAAGLMSSLGMGEAAADDDLEAEDDMDADEADLDAEEADAEEAEDTAAL